MTARPLPALLALCLCASPGLLRAQAPAIPDWALPGSATHQQVPPPADFHRATRTTETPLGVFTAQSDIGGAVIPGSASFDAATGRYTITSAGYNIWYTRDEFRYVWVRMSGDASLAATITFPNAQGYFDRKAVLVVRQSLDDDSREIMAALHGGGLIHLAQRPSTGANLKENFRIKRTPEQAAIPARIGIEKQGDSFSLYISLAGEPMHAAASGVTLHFDEPFYVGIGFCSHQPATPDSAVLSAVVLENAAGKAR